MHWSSARHLTIVIFFLIYFYDIGGLWPHKLVFYLKVQNDLHNIYVLKYS